MLLTCEALECLLRIRRWIRPLLPVPQIYGRPLLLHDTPSYPFHAFLLLRHGIKGKFVQKYCNCCLARQPRQLAAHLQQRQVRSQERGSGQVEPAGTNFAQLSVWRVVADQSLWSVVGGRSRRLRGGRESISRPWRHIRLLPTRLLLRALPAGGQGPI